MCGVFKDDSNGQTYSTHRAGFIDFVCCFVSIGDYGRFMFFEEKSIFLMLFCKIKVCEKGSYGREIILIMVWFGLI